MKTTIYLSLGLQKGRQLQKKPLQPRQFLNFILLLWVIFALLDPDSGYGSTDLTLTESGSNLDPDPKQYNE